MPAKKSNPIKLVIVIVVLLGVAAAATAYWLQSRKPQPLVLSGTLEARTANVGSLVGGRVTRVLVDEGSHVTPGQTLLTLETETIDRQVAEQRAAIDAAKAQLAKLRAGSRPEEIAKAAAVASNDARDRERYLELWHYGIVAKMVYDDAATKATASAEDLRLLQKGSRTEDIAAAQAQAEQQEKRLATLQKNRAETEVHSPIAGVVQSFGLRPGDLVAPNQSVAEILEPDQLWVRVFVPETLLGLVHTGQQVRVRIDTYPDRSFLGHVATVNAQGEYTPRNVQTRAQRAEEVFGVKVLVDPDPALKAGMAAEVDLGVSGRAQ